VRVGCRAMSKQVMSSPLPLLFAELQRDRQMFCITLSVSSRFASTKRREAVFTASLLEQTSHSPGMEITIVGGPDCCSLGGGGGNHRWR